MPDQNISRAVISWVKMVIPWEECSAKLGLNKELSVEREWSRVEWRSRDGWVNVIGCGDRVASS